jgi:hypothetical protein
MGHKDVRLFLQVCDNLHNLLARACHSLRALAKKSEFCRTKPVMTSTFCGFGDMLVDRMISQRVYIKGEKK